MRLKADTIQLVTVMKIHSHNLSLICFVTFTRQNIHFIMIIKQHSRLITKQRTLCESARPELGSASASLWNIAHAAMANANGTAPVTASSQCLRRLQNRDRPRQPYRCGLANHMFKLSRVTIMELYRRISTALLPK